MRGAAASLFSVCWWGGPRTCCWRRPPCRPLPRGGGVRNRGWGSRSSPISPPPLDLDEAAFASAY
eukprot:6031322-Alexandrium_andersonii.AAC.1